MKVGLNIVFRLKYFCPVVTCPRKVEPDRHVVTSMTLSGVSPGAHILRLLEESSLRSASTRARTASSVAPTSLALAGRGEKAPGRGDSRSTSIMLRGGTGGRCGNSWFENEYEMYFKSSCNYYR